MSLCNVKQYNTVIYFIGYFMKSIRLIQEAPETKVRYL